jgi:hypothetical protein
MPPRAFSRSAIALLAAALLLPACGGNGDITDQGGHHDTPVQTDTPPGPDGPGPDGTVDAADAAPDLTPDVGLDGGLDLGDVPTDMTGQGPVPVGTGCSRSVDCGTNGVCLSGNTVPNGYCSATCNVSADCGTGAECVTGAQGKFCLASCTADSDCRADEGYICQAGVLDATGKVCVAGTTGTAGANPGDACTQDSDCPRAGFCLQGSAGFPGGYCVTGCDPQTANACGDGFTCVTNPGANAFCVQACGNTSDCRQDYSCASGIIGLATDGTVCAPGKANRVTPGSACASHGDCTAGAGFCRLEAPGGYCTEICNPTSAQAQQCGVGATCAAVSPAAPTTGLCLASCTPGVGTECTVVRTGDPNAARYGCSTQAFGEQLGSGGVCLEFTSGADVGGACASTGDCQLGGLCLPESTSNLGGGYCSDLCTSGSNTDPCAAGQVCFNTGTVGLCLDGCTTDADCRTGDDYACRGPLPGGGSACLPKPCTTNTDCQQSAQSCRAGAGGGGNVCSPCRSNDDCNPGATCAQGRCRLGA